MEAIKSLVLIHGQRGAARIAGLKEATVQQWAKRYHWKSPLARKLERRPSKVASPICQESPSNALAKSLQQQKADSTLNLAIYTARAAERAAKHKKPLDIARKVRDVAGVYSTLYPNENAASTILNVAILTGKNQPERINLKPLP